MEPNILVLDDDPHSRQSLVGSLNVFGCNVIAPDGPFCTIDSLREYAHKTKATHLLTDQRLTERRFSDFLGAKAAATAFDMGIAPILITSYLIQDMDRDIRPHLASIPKIIHRSHSNPKVLFEALEEASAEVHGGRIRRSRRRCRSVVKVQEILPSHQKSGSQLRLLVRQWRKDETVGFPAKALPIEIQNILQPGTLFIAEVNIEAEENQSLFLTDFELLPEDEINDF